MTGLLRSRAVIALCAVGLVLTGCSDAPEPPVTPSTQLGAVTIVTVPGLTSPAAGPGATGAGEDGVTPAVPSATGSAAPSGTVDSPTSASTAPPETSRAGATTTSPQGVSVAPASPSRNPGTSTPPAPGSSTPAGPSTVAVDLASCSGCHVIGVAAEVQPGLAAALATAPQGAVLLATRPDGAVVGVTNVPYGVTFPAPAGAVLPCDRSGRCFVTAAAAQGTGVISVFQLAADGQWRDVTSAGGFTSATTAAAVRDVDGDGLLDIAVQAAAADSVRWVVYHWSGDRFVVLGCAPGPGSAPDGAAVSLAACS